MDDDDDCLCIEQEFVDKIVAAIAANRYNGKPPTKKEVESWFRYATKIAEARQKFSVALIHATLFGVE